MARWRQRIREDEVEKSLAATIDAGKAAGLFPENSVDKVIVDTTVKPKTWEHPIEAQLY
jgi:hypothetical protein